MEHAAILVLASQLLSGLWMVIAQLNFGQSGYKKSRKMMKDMTCHALSLMSDHLEALRQFRQAIHKSFPYRRDSLLDLLDALSRNDRARSTVELSLHPYFRGQYSALYKTISQAYVESDSPVCSREAYQQGAVMLDTLPPPRDCKLVCVRGQNQI